MAAKFQVNDGGRAAAGYKGKAGDCVCRAVAIASGRPYQEIYDRLAKGNAAQRKGKRSRPSKGDGQETADHGIIVRRKWFKDYMVELGATWVPTMKIGSGCQVHLRSDELPAGRLVVAVSRHYTTVINGVINDTYDCSREGTRCVYGYWMFPATGGQVASVPPVRSAVQPAKRSRKVAAPSKATADRPRKATPARQAATLINDPCEKLMITLLGDPFWGRSGNDHDRLHPCEPDVVEAIAKAMDGEKNQWSRLTSRLLPGERRLVAQAIKDAREFAGD